MRAILKIGLPILVVAVLFSYFAVKTQGATDPSLTISNVQVTGITKSSVLINWDGSETSYMNILYGITNAYGYTQPDTWTGFRRPTSHHFFFVSGLAPDTTYNFCPQIVDPNTGNYSVCDGTTNNFTFKTAPGTSAPTPPALPKVQVDTTMPTVTGQTFKVDADCDNLQEQINAAAAANGNQTQQVVIPAGTVCTGVYSAPPKSAGSGWVIVRTSTPDNQLPPAGTRVTPADAPLLATIQDNGWNSHNYGNPGDVCTKGQFASSQLSTTNFDVLDCVNGALAHVNFTSGTVVPSSCTQGTWFDKTDETDFYRIAWYCITPNHFINMSFGAWPRPSGEAMEVESGASHYRFVGLNITNTPTPSYAYRNMDYGALVLVPTDADHIIFDHIYLHGAPSPSKESYGLILDGSNIAVIDSYVDNLSKYRDNLGEVEDNADAIEILQGPGPYKIQNNYLSAVGIIVFITDDENTDVNLAHPPADGTFVGNYLHHDPIYDDGSSASNGYNYFNRNMLEFKLGSRWLINGNVFDGNFGQTNQGAAMVFYGRATLPYPIPNTTAQVADMTITNNIIRNVPTGIVTGGFNDNAGDGEALDGARMKVANNLFENIDGYITSPNSQYSGGLPGLAAEVIDGPEDVVYDHNTIYREIGTTPSSVAIDGDILPPPAPNPHPGVGFQFTNNIAWNHTVYNPVLTGGGSDYGTTQLNVDFQTAAATTTPSWNVAGNVIMYDSNSLGANQSTLNPPGNNWVPDITGPGFANPSVGNYTITNASLKGTATDGTDPGVNMAALNGATQNTISGGSGYATNAAASGPIIYNIAADGSAGTTATISWTTDWTATAQVKYGKTTAYGNQTAVTDTNTVSCSSPYTIYPCRGLSSHAVTLPNLTPGTLYHYAVISTDDYGDTTVSADQTFTAGSGGVMAPPTISAVSSGVPSSTTATITWTTDQTADSQVSYGVSLAGSYPSSSPLDSALKTSHAVVLTGLTPKTLYHYRVASKNANGLSASPDGTFTTTNLSVPPDTIPPSIPTGLAVAGVTTSTVSLSWHASTDNVGVAGYTIYRRPIAAGGITLSALLIATTSATSYQDIGLSPLTTYIYTVLAYDAAGNQSAKSLPAAATTGSSDTITPTVSVTSPLANASVSSTILVAATASDNVGVTSLQFTLDGSAMGSPITAPPYQIFWNTALVSTGAHTLGAIAKDAAQNQKTSLAVPVVVTRGAPDTTPPTAVVTSPVAHATVSGTVPVTATASDNGVVVKVELYVDGILEQNTTAAPYTFLLATDALVNGTHSLFVKAYDAAGNIGTSPIIAVTVANAAQTLTANLTASPTAGTAPLSVSLTASVGGTAQGTVNYIFYCNRADTGTNITSPANLTVNASAATTYTATNLCTYAAGGTNTTKVIVERGTAPVTQTERAVVVQAAATGTPLIISNVIISEVGENSAELIVTTDNPASIQVQYGPTASYGNTTHGSPDLTSAFVNLANLAAGTTYDFRVIATPETGAAVTSGNYVFVTANTPPSGGGGGGGYPHPPITTPVPPVTNFPTPATTSSPVLFFRNLKVKDSGNDVIALQNALKSLGFLPITVSSTGYFGSLTEHALLLFQGTHQLTDSGYLDSPSQALLNKVVAENPTLTGGVTPTAPGSGTPTVSASSTATSPAVIPVGGSFTRRLGLGSQGDDVSLLQEKLFDDGDYPKDLITGYYGTLTEQAVQAFQAKYGIISYGTPETTGYGAVGPKTLAKLDGV